MRVISDLTAYTRFALGLPGYMRRPITLAEGESTIREGLRRRADNFLNLLEKGIFGYPRSPYLPLLQLAGIEMGDIKALLLDVGLEGTLLALREAGVYVTFDEFKSQDPIVRAGQVIDARPSDFDNPFLQHFYYARTSGSTGAGTRAPVDLDHIGLQNASNVVAYHAHGITGLPRVIWLAAFPNSSGPNQILRHVGMGERVDRWYSPVGTRSHKRALRDRLATLGLVAVGRLSGVPVPRPRLLAMDQASTIAQWMADAIRSHGGAQVITSVSNALRICIASEAAGLDLHGGVMIVGGEPPTPAKVDAIKRAGVRPIPNYHLTEAGAVGVSCANPVDENDLHLIKELHALIQFPRRVPGTDMDVNAFNLTSLSPTAPKLMLNVEIDDYGVVEKRDCGCPLGAVGYADHIREIRSYRKLTGEGVSLVGGEMIHILEHVLPSRFGGSPLDYQLVEEEDERGLTRLNLVISPSVDIADEEAVIQTVLAALRRGSGAANLAQAYFDQAGSLQVKRAEPVVIGHGKLNPLHLDKRSGLD